MNIKPYPLILNPTYKDYIWGGDQIEKIFGKNHGLDSCAESWELADRPEGQSTIANGSLRCEKLDQVIAMMKDSLTGRGTSFSPFPLLVKIIDASKKLSVQVHPNQATAKKTGGEPKTEMWYVLDAKPGSFVYAGLKNGITPETFKAHLETGDVESVLKRLPVKKDDAVFIPGGRIHAIGKGCLLLEVQQNSNTTYRVYDWGRVGKDGKPRQTHLEQAMETINWHDEKTALLKNEQSHTINGNTLTRIIHCAYFTMDRIDLRKRHEVILDGKNFHVIFVLKGKISVNDELVTKGTTCLIPAAMPGYTIKPVNDSAQVLQITGNQS